MLPAVAAVEARAARRRTPIPGGGMLWREWGTGPPVVLLHGASGSWTHWIRNIPALAERFRVLAPDLPGFGDSDLPPGPHTAEALASALLSGLDCLVPPAARLDLVGFSFGGIVAGLAAAGPTPRVRALVLVGPNGMALPRQPLPALRRLAPEMPEREQREAHRENLRRLMLGDPAAADDLAVALHAANLERARFRAGTIPDSDVLLRALPGVRARLAGLWGERDVYAAPYLDARRRTLGRFAPDLDFRVVPGAGHWVPWEAPGTVNAALLEILGPGAR